MPMTLTSKLQRALGRGLLPSIALNLSFPTPASDPGARKRFRARISSAAY